MDCCFMVFFSLCRRTPSVQLDSTTVHLYLPLLFHLRPRLLINIVTSRISDRFSPMDLPTPALIMSTRNDPRLKSVHFKRNPPTILRRRPSTWANKHRCRRPPRNPFDRQPIKIRIYHTISAVLRHHPSVTESVVCPNGYSRISSTEMSRQGKPQANIDILSHSMMCAFVSVCAISCLLHLVAISYFLVPICMFHCTSLVIRVRNCMFSFDFKAFSSFFSVLNMQMTLSTKANEKFF